MTALRFLLSTPLALACGLSYAAIVTTRPQGTVSRRWWAVVFVGSAGLTVLVWRSL